MSTIGSLHLTTRGWVVAAVAAAGLVLGLFFGARSLNAVVAPAIVALVFAGWRMRRLHRPSIERIVPDSAMVGDSVEVTLAFDEPVERLGNVHERLDEGIVPEVIDRPVDLGEGIDYTIELERRGRFELGPTTLVVRDVFGLIEQTFEYSTRSSILAYPRIHPVSTDGLDRLAALTNIQLKRERHEFDRLREYRPEDSLRDIHWKSSAKQPNQEFIVKEFIRATEHGSVVLSGEATAEGVDVLAEAFASLSISLLDHGVRLQVHTSDGSVGPIETSSHVSKLLTHLATFGEGTPRERGNVHLEARSDQLEQIHVHVGDEEMTLGSLLTTADTLAPVEREPIQPMEVAD